MIFEPGAAFRKKSVGQHLTRPFNRQISGEDPDIGGGPDRAVFVRKLRMGNQIAVYGLSSVVSVYCCSASRMKSTSRVSLLFTLRTRAWRAAAT